MRGLPEYTGLVQYFNPLGKTWYDAPQAKATKRLSHALDALVSYDDSRFRSVGQDAILRRVANPPGDVSTSPEERDWQSRAG
ncbi:MAG: hypothetical protein JO307_18915 [Bryobacterales bacterium]|nr:hypothetical protein [Bryobacterales bacterium]